MKQIVVILIVLISLNYAVEAYSHAGHDEAPGSDSSTGVTNVILSDAAINNLGIKTVKAEIKPHALTIDLNGMVEFLPERQAVVNSRASGRISEIHVKVGEKVNKGQNLLTIQPIFVGSMPVAITSPINGYVTKQSVILGQSITPETPLIEVGDSSEVLVKGVMYETPDINKIQVGQKARVITSLIVGESLEGKVQKMDSAFDRGTRTFNIYALVQNPDRKLIANMQVVLSVEVTTPADILTIPVKAILGDSGEQFVFIKNGNEFERRNIKIGTKFGSEREILEGVFPDEEIVTVGNYQLQFAKSSDKKEKSDDHDHEH